MFEQLVLEIELTEQQEPTSSIKHEVRSYSIDSPKDFDDMMKMLNDELRFAVIDRCWPNNPWEPEENCRHILDRYAKKKQGLVIPPYVGTIRIDINYSRKGWNHE